MELRKITESFDELIYEIALWVIFVPKTVLKVIVQPSWVSRYVKTELDKDPSSRWEEYLSPVLFLVLVGVIPWLFLLDIWASPEQVPNSTNSLSSKFLGLPFEIQLLSLITILLALPLGYSIIIMWRLKKPITRTFFKGIFYTECYLVTPLILGIFFLFLNLDFRLNPPFRYNADSPYLIASACITSIFFWWFVYSQSRLFIEELQVGWLKALGHWLLGYFAWVLLTFPLELLVLMAIVYLPHK